MSFKYQALLGNTIIDADSIVVDELVAEKGIIANLDVTKDLHVDGMTELNEVKAVDASIDNLTVNTSLILPTGSGEGKVLTSDAVGKTYWNDNALAGDITGPTSANVQHHKWIGNWDVLVPYQKFNRVTHEYIEYRAKDDNLGMEPSLDPDGVWEAVLSYRPDTVFEEKAQPLRNKTDVDVVDLTVRSSAKFTIQPTSIFEITPRYLVGTGVNKDELRWANNLDAQQVSCRNTFYYENDGRADAGKVLTCVGNTGACNWEYPTQTNAVTMGGDVTGSSNASVINTLAGGTIQVSDLMTVDDIPTLPADIVYEDKAQPLRNKTDVDVVTLMVRDSMKLQLPTLNSGVFALKYLVGWNNPDFNDCKWVNDLYAPIVSAQSQLLYPVGASAGKILSCVDGTGLAAWTDPPNTTVTMTGDVTGNSSASTVYTLAGGTIPVNQLVTLNGTQTLKYKMLNDASNIVFANGLRGGNGWAIPLSGSGPTTNQVLSYNGSYGTWTTPTFPTLGGDVTGSYGATTVNTLGGGTLPVDQIVTITGEQICRNKHFEGITYFSDLTRYKLFRLNLDNVTATSTTNLCATSSASQTFYLPNIPLSSDTLMCKNTTDDMKNKTLPDASNVVHANAIRYSPTWTANFAGSPPTTNQVLRFDGTNAVWGGVTSLVTLAGDANGPAGHNVVTKATNDFSVGRLLNCKFGVQVKKLVLHEGGGSISVNDHDFQGFGTSDFIMRYQVNATSRSHVFYAAISATASNELARISGEGDLSVARTISASNGDRIKKVVLYEGGTATSTTDHRYNGLGTSASTLRYHVNAVGDNHVFYAATSATASNELFKIAGDGRTTAKMINVETWREPNIQGAWMGWNRNSGTGATTFVNQMGLGTGGWEWLNYNNSNVQTPSGNPSMKLDRDGNLTVRGRVISEGVPDAFSGNWWSADYDIILLTVPLQSSGLFCNLRETITSINFSAWTNNATGIFLPVAGYFRISYRFRLAPREKNNIMLKCNVSVGGTNHPSLYTFDTGLTYEHDLHCEAIVNISAPNMWVTYPKLTVLDSSMVTSPKNFDLFTGHFTIEKMK